MDYLNYGVVKQDGYWKIVGEQLRFGRYKRRTFAIRAARRLAVHSCGLPVRLHVQDETGELLPPRSVNARAN